MEINEITFYKVGRACFLIIAICNTLNLIYTFQFQNLFTFISACANIIFSIALFFMFNYLLKLQQGTIENVKFDEEEFANIEELLKSTKKKS